MDTLSAFTMGINNRHREPMVFDWNKAAWLISENHPTKASAGLASDWEWTGGIIYRDGVPVPTEETYTYLMSTWATPQLCMDGVIIDCFLMKSKAPPEWDASTYWPESALDILKREYE